LVRPLTNHCHVSSGPILQVHTSKNQHSWLEKWSICSPARSSGKNDPKREGIPTDSILNAEVETTKWSRYCLMVQKSCQPPVTGWEVSPKIATGFIEYISGSSPDFLNYQQRINWKNEAFQDGSEYDVFSNVFSLPASRGKNGMFQPLPTQKSRVIGPSMAWLF